MIGIIERIVNIATSVSGLLKDLFTGETISDKWTETEGGNVTITQKDGLIFQDVNTSGNATISRLRSVQTFNPANYPVLVLRGKLTRSDVIAPLGIRFFKEGDNPDIIGFQGSYNYNDRMDCLVYENGSQTSLKGITQSFNTAFKVKITQNTAFYYVWQGGAWLEVHNAPYSNKQDLYVEIYRTGKSINNVLSTVEEVYVTEFDYETYSPENNEAPIQKPGLKAYYSFDKGYAFDDYSNQHGRNFGATVEINGKEGSGFTFDGVNDYIELPFTFNQLFCDASNVFTVGCWFKSTDLSGQHIVLNYGGGTGSAANFTIYTNNTDLTVLIRGAYSNIGTVTLNNWNLILVRWDGTTAIAFFNGIKTTLSVGTSIRQDFGNGIRFGQNCANANQTLPAWFKGVIDESPFFTTAITDEKAAEIWNGGNGITLEQL